jgi:hypothetical protein
MDGKIVERFDCYEGTSAKAKLSKDLYVQGINFFARKPELPGKASNRESKSEAHRETIEDSELTSFIKKESFKP